MSVVILAKNAAATIKVAVDSAFLVAGDVVVVDSGSDDGTREIAMRQGARILDINWTGYGQARNAGAAFAYNDCILNIDSDEVITPGLAQHIKKETLDKRMVYGFKRLNYLGSKAIKYGEWGKDKVFRLYNKTITGWNTDAVHETINNNSLQRKLLPGILLHYTTTGIDAYTKKLDRYAMLSAQKFGEQQKKIKWHKPWLSPVFNFVKYYIFHLGFLDGQEGWQIAKAHYGYSKKKYRYYRAMLSQK